MKLWIEHEDNPGKLDPVEIDYEAATTLFDSDLAWIVEACGENRTGPNLAVDALVARIVDAALGASD